MRSNDEAVIFWDFPVYIDQQFFIGWPGAAGNNAFSATDKAFDICKSFGLLGNAGNPVETGVARKGNPFDTDRVQKLYRNSILHEKIINQL